MNLILSVVVPLLNEEEIVEELIKRLKISLDRVSENYEIILVDDGSNDRTWEKISLISKIDNRVKGIKLSRNFGHHYAISAGLHNAHGEWVVVMDGDLQDRPEVIPELFYKAKEGFDVVFVSRNKRPESIFYKILQKLFYVFLRRLSGIDFDSRQANFSILNHKVVEAFKKFPEHSRFYGSTIKWLGFKRTFIEAEHGKRYSGKPSYTIKKRLNLALDIILSFSDRPLKFAIGLGLALSGLSFLILIWILIGYMSWGFTVIGWPSIIASIFLSSGAILVVLGVIGIYLGRVFNEVKSRPLYVIDDSVNIEKIS
jgi:glycosyltransferase involved in cell wall biosynthesis